MAPSPNTDLTGDFKGAVSGKNLTGDYILAQEEQSKNFVFCQALSQKVLCAYIENTPGKEYSIKTKPTLANFGPK